MKANENVKIDVILIMLDARRCYVRRNCNSRSELHLNKYFHALKTVLAQSLHVG